MKIDEVIEAGKQLEQAVPKPVPAPAQPAKVIPFPRTAPSIPPGAANDPKFKQGVIDKYGPKAWEIAKRFLATPGLTKLPVWLAALVTPSNVGAAYNFPQEGPLKGSEINPITGKPWTPGELEQYKLDPEKYAKQKPVKPTPGPDQSDAETARLQRQAQPIGDPVKEPAAPPKPAAPPTITPAEPAPAPAPAPAPKVEPEVKPPAQTAPAPKPVPGPEFKPAPAPSPAPNTEPTPQPKEQPKTEPAPPQKSISPIVTPSSDTDSDGKSDWWRYGGMPGGKVGSYVPDRDLKENKKMIHSTLVERWNKFKEADVNAADPEAQTFVPPLNAKVQPTAAAKQADPKNTGTAQDPEAQTFVGTTTNPVTPAAQAVARAAQQQPEPTPLPSVLRTIPPAVQAAADAVKPVSAPDQNITVKPTSWQELAKNNPQIKNPNLIYPGQEITLPGGEKYVVGRGDTLSGIAKWHNKEMIPQKPKLQMPDQILNQIPGVESGNNPKAVGAAGEVGAWQTMPSTLKNPGFGVKPARDNSAEETARVGKEYANAMYNRYGGDADKALAAYNAGPGRVDQAIKLAKQRGGNWQDYIPKSTRGYLAKYNTKPTAQVAEETTRRRKREEPEMDYDDPEWTSKVERLRKLAGMGPLKTVWDPVKRVYKNVPVNNKKEVNEYGNAQDPNNQSTSPDATGSAQQDMQNDMQSNTTQQAAELAKQKAAQQQDAAIARNIAGGLSNVLPPGTSPDAMASGITKMNDGKPLEPQEQQAVSQITPLVMKAAETPGLAGQLKSALQNAGVLARQGK